MTIKLPSLPYSALALAAVSHDLIRKQIEQSTWSVQRITRINAIFLSVLCVCIVMLTFCHTVAKRDHALLHDLSVLEKTLATMQKVQIPVSMADDWAKHAYFIRYLGVSLDHRAQHAYYVSLLNEEPPTDSYYLKLPLTLQYVSVYHCD